MLDRNGSRVHTVRRGRYVQPSVYLDFFIVREFETANEAPNEDAFFRADFQVGPGKRTDEFHQLKTIRGGEFIQHGFKPSAVYSKVE